MQVKLLLFTCSWMADCMQFLSVNSVNGRQIFGEFGFLKTESKHNFGFLRIPIQRNITRKWDKIELYWLSDGTIFNHLECPNPDFKVTPLFEAEYLRNGTWYGHSIDGILLWTYTRPYSRVSFWMTVKDSAKYSMTQSVARSACDSWASCLVS